MRFVGMESEAEQMPNANVQVPAMEKKLKFSGHQTFTFRYGWLEKGVRAVEESPQVFTADDAIVRLGVGKNMVESIRHWCLMTQLIQANTEPTSLPSPGFRTTQIAQRLLLTPGFDPFFEDDASLWLIHWLLVSNPFIGSSWQLAFGHFHRPDFSKRELVDFVKAYAERHSVRITESSLVRDIDCLLRSYLAVRDGGRGEVAEETFDCPLQELGLIQPSPDGEFYRFSIGPKPSLPPPVFAFALDQFFRAAKADRSTISVQECLYGIGSPGQAFKLDENSLVDYVESIELVTAGAITLDETAGLKQIYRRRNLDPLKLLENHYGTKAS